MHEIWKNLSREEAIARSKPILATIPFVARPACDSEQQADIEDDNSPGAVPAAKPKQVCMACQKLGLSLSRTQHKIMEDICEDPSKEIRDRCERLGLPRETESVERRGLMNFGLIEFIGSVGNRRLFFSPTKDRGEKWREAHSLQRWSEHGGPIHTFIVTKSEKKLSLARPGTKFVRRRTGEPGGVRPDSLALPTGATGQRIALQAAAGHQPRGEALNLLKLCGLRKEVGNQDPAGWIDLVVSIGLNKRVQNSIERAVRDLNNGEVPSNLVFYSAEDVLDPSVDWSVLLEREI